MTPREVARLLDVPGVAAVRWGIVYYATEGASAPGLDFLKSCPINVRAKLVAVLEAVPPVLHPRQRQPCRFFL
jgi:hypothetical protein